MSFLRALRAYVGLGPDDEIEDRYLTELNARRRQLALDEISPDRRRGGEHDLEDAYGVIDHGERTDAAGAGDDHGGGYRVDDNGDGEDVVVRPRSGRRSDPRRRAAAMVDEFEGFDPNDELDLAFMERMSAVGGGRRGRGGRHDIEPDAPLESIVDDDGVEAVRVRARADRSPADAPDVGVVHSLDSMRAKPRTLMPESFADAKVVADEFKRDIPVVLNLQAVERDLARRMIDFASGICYVLDGSMEKIASQVFLLVPDSVEVSDEDRRRIEERGYAR